jgi:phosphoenolpyruvate carboxylase
MPARRRDTTARQAEPRGIGSAGAPDPLAREVKLLGSLLGQVVAEQEGKDRFDLVETLRSTAVRHRRGTDATPAELTALDDLPVDELTAVARAFTAYFLLINLAEEKQRLRILRRRQRQNAGRPLADGVDAAFESLTKSKAAAGEVRSLIRRMELRPVLTAHPTEARRRTVLVAQRRIYRLLDRLDDPRLTPAEDRDIRRRLREEITVLWQTAQVRESRPTPLDEVRAAMVFFDETIFVAAPRLIRAVDEAAPRVRSERPERPVIGSFLHFGSWIGGDRDGHPGVTAETTRATQRIHADHLLRGYRSVAERLQQTIAVSADQVDVPATYRRRLTDALRAFPNLRTDLERRFPRQPYRQAFGLIAERLQRTRRRLTDERGARRGAYASPDDLLEDLRAMQSALASHAAGRVAWGEVQNFVWQVETFGFHLASLEVRQHADVHAAALDRLRRGSNLEAALGDGSGPSTREVLASIAAMFGLQGQHGTEVAHRYVISFTRSVDDALALLELTARATADDPRQAPDLAAARLPIDVVPLFESRDALGEAGSLLSALLDDPTYQSHLERRGNRQEVMLGYSDSNKEVGYLAASWSLHRAQASLVKAAARAGVELTLFHGRGGSIGRGGGPANRAVLAQAPGSVDGRLKLTEQGEVIAERYPSPAIALRHLEQLTNATLLASFVPVDRHAAFMDRFGPMMDELASLAEAAYGALVWKDASFAAYYAAATPIAEITRLELGSRPARRGAAAEGVPDLESLRAIPWAFAWSQSRANVPAWYGVGTALATHAERHGTRGRDLLAEAHREWPFFSTTLENVELGLAIADPTVASRYARLAGEASAMRRIGAAIAEEFERTVAGVLAVTGHERLMDRSPRLQRSIALRNPYVDVLSEIQLRCLARLRAARTADPDGEALERLLQLTVSGIAAGLQHTG